MIPAVYAAPIDGLFTAYNVLLALFGVYGARYARQERAGFRIALGLLAVSAIAGLLMRWFPMDAREATPSAAGAVHWVLAIAAALIAIVAPLLVGLARRGDARKPNLVRFSLACAAIILISGGLTAAGASLRFAYFGAIERVTIGAFVLWVLVMARQLQHRQA